MTKFLRKSEKGTILSPTLTKVLHVSLHPRSNCHRKNRIQSIPFILIAAFVLSPVCQYAFATQDNHEHGHRHHHAPNGLHRVIRRNSGKNNEQHEGELPILNKCSETWYPKQWENMMDELDKSDNVQVPLSSEKFQEEINRLTEKLSVVQTHFSTVEQNDDKSEEFYTMGHNAEMISYWNPNGKILHGAGHQVHNFRLKTNKQFDCPEKSDKVLHWHSFGTDMQNQLRTVTISHDKSITFSNLTLIAKDGRLVWNQQNGGQYVYERANYCIWKSGDEWVTFKICQPNCSDRNTPCIRKCCPPWEFIDKESRKCKSTSMEWRPTFFKTDRGTVDHDVYNGSLPFATGFVKCLKKYKREKDAKNKLLINGTLVHIEEDDQTFINPGDFCIDGLFNHSDPSSVSHWDQVIIACKPNTEELYVEDKRIQASAVLNFISAMFLLLTDIVYILIWRHQNNIHSWLQFSYATSLFLTFTCFFIVKLFSEQLLNIPQLCKVMGWLSHLTYLSAFFWLTSMNFDLWWRFSRPLRSTRVQTQDKKRKRFFGFALFSIMLPLMISCISITLDSAYGELFEPPLLLPGFGKEKCYFENNRSQIPYLYFPAGILLLVDFIFFASTVLHLRKMHNHTELARTQSTSTMEDKKGLRLIAKLFLVMGVLWIFELLNWISRLLFTDPDQKRILKYIFTPIDCLNSLQGVFIFFILICKPNVRNQLAALFRKDGVAKTWNMPTQLPSETTVQQPLAKQNHYVEIK